MGTTLYVKVCKIKACYCVQAWLLWLCLECECYLMGKGCGWVPEHKPHVCRISPLHFWLNLAGSTYWERPFSAWSHPEDLRPELLPIRVDWAQITWWLVSSLSVLNLDHLSGECTASKASGAGLSLRARFVYCWGTIGLWIISLPSQKSLTRVGNFIYLYLPFSPREIQAAVTHIKLCHFNPLYRIIES